MKSPLRTRRGMSVVEVMISLGILGFGAACLANLFTSTSKGVRDSRLRTTAAQIAVQRVEFLAGQGIDQLPTCQGAVSCRAGRAQFAPAMSDSGAYRCSQLVDGMDLDDPSSSRAQGTFRIDTVISTPADPRQRDGARIVTVNVCWSDGRTVHLSQAERLLVPEV